MSKAPGRYWIIRHPDSQGAIVGKFDTEGETVIPEEVANHDSFKVQKVSDRSTLTNKTVDHSGLTESEKRVLEKVYPVE